MPDLRELFDDPEEGFRAMFNGLQRHLHTSMVARVTQASEDGHAVQAQPVVQQQIQDPTLTKTTLVDYPLVPDAVVKYPGGAGMTLTHGWAVDDETMLHFAMRPLDFWRTMGGTAPPPSDRIHSLSDAVASGSVRSDPNRLQQVDAQAMHLRDDAKHAVHEVKPGVGVQSFHADPSTPPASPSFDPLAQASKFLSHAVQAARGIVGRAVNGSTEHSHGVDHGVGAWMKALAPSGLMQVLAHPALGSLLSAANGAHSVTATSGGVMLQSATAIALQCPASGLSLPSGSISAGSMAAGAAAQNVGALSGDLAGSLPNPQVVSLAHVVGQNTALVQAASDSAAATAGVAVGSLYINTAVKSGVGVLAVRLA